MICIDADAEDDLLRLPTGYVNAGAGEKAVCEVRDAARNR